MVQNGPKWWKMIKMVKNDQNRQKWSKSPKMVKKWSKMAKNGQNRPKSSKMVQNGQKWSKIVKIVKMVKMVKMILNGPKRWKRSKFSKMVKITKNGQTCQKCCKGGSKKHSTQETLDGEQVSYWQWNPMWRWAFSLHFKQNPIHLIYMQSLTSIPWLTHYPIIVPSRGSHGLSARRVQRTKSSRPEGLQPRSRAPEGP